MVAARTERHYPLRLEYIMAGAYESLHLRPGRASRRQAGAPRSDPRVAGAQQRLNPRVVRRRRTSYYFIDETCGNPASAGRECASRPLQLSMPGSR